MNKQIFSMLLVALLLARASLAQAGAGVSDRFLEERVTEEVAEEGLSLARLGLRVVVQQQNGGARIEIVEQATGRVVTTRSVKRLAKEREAMVAELTMIASALLREHSSGPRGKGEKSGVLATLSESPGGLGLAKSHWSVAMAPAEILARHRPSSIHVITMPSGALSDEASLAARELANAYRSGGVAAVEGPDTARSKDAMAVVKRFASSSAAELALVSVGRLDDSLRAVVTIYSKRGDVLTAMSLSAGVALESASEDGVSLPSDALGTIGTIKGDRKAAMKEYLRERVALSSIMVAGNGYIGNLRMAHKGLLGDPLSGAAFYRAVGRDDYAKRYDEVSSKKSRGYWIGGAGVLGVISFGSWAMTMGLISAADDSADHNWELPTLLTAASAGFMVGGLWYARAQGDPHAVNEAGRIKLAEAYNESLRNRLGLTVEDTGTIEETAARYNLQLQPYVNGSGGGLGVGGSF